MTFPPDKYLQGKFAQERKSPPPEVWNRIQAGLDQRKSKRLWLRYSAAAAVILLAASITMLQVYKPTTSNPLISSGKTNTEEITIEPTNTIQATQTESQIATNNISNEVNVSVPVSSNNSHKKSQKNIQPVAETNEKLTSTQTKVVSTSAITLSQPDPLAEEVTLAEEPVVTIPQTGKKIYYSAAEVNARFLKKKDTVASPPPEKNETGIQKILDIAYDLKFSESTLGELRQYKNDILSIPGKKTQGKTN